MEYFKEHKIRALEEEMHVIEMKLKELKLMTCPDSDVQETISCIAELFDKITIALYNSNNHEGKNMSLLSELVNILYKYICCIINTNTKNNPREIMIPVKQILKKVNSEHLFIAEPSLEFNYAVGSLINSKEFHQILQQLDTSFDVNKHIIRLIFPILHQSDILGGAVMGHELGHYLDIHYGMNLTEKILTSFMSKIDFNTYSVFFKNIPNNISRDDVIRGYLPNFTLKNWIKEIIADIIGTLLYGISSFFSLQHVITVNTKMDIINNICYQNFSETHPRNSFRTFTILETLKKVNCFDFIENNLKNKIYEYETIWESANTSPYNPQSYSTNFNITIEVNSKYLSTLENDLKNNLDWIINLVYDDLNNISSNIIYDFSNLKNNVPLAVNKIIDIIPPNEINDAPLDFISILNAGWIAYIMEFQKIKNNVNNNKYTLENFEIKEIIDNLLKKATISSSIHQRWLNNETLA